MPAPIDDDDESWLDTRPEAPEPAGAARGGGGAMLPIDPNDRANIRDDEHTDFAVLLRQGMVRSKQGGAISIDQPHNDFSPRQRDELYQGYCGLARSGASPESLRTWLDARCQELGMSLTRARNIINEGNGQYPGQNMQWWRGVSLPTP